MTELARKATGLETGILLASDRPSDCMRDWLIDQDQFDQRIENTELLVDRLLQEREALLNYAKAMRLWAYELISGTRNMIEEPRDLMLLEAMKNLPDHLLEEIQRDD
jgi:hypothetical protein